jgi:hypothetical protein
MSYDLWIWNTLERLTHARAVDLCGKMCGEDFSDLLPTPKIDAFYHELTAKYPEINEVPLDAGPLPVELRH